MRVQQVLFLLAVAACGTLAIPSYQQQQPQEGSEPVLCDIYSDCVGPYLCVNGQIDTTGAGYIDLRAGASGRVYCSSPDVCCRKPGIPAPHPYCPAGKACLSDNLCNADGTYNSNGQGDSSKAQYPLTTCLLEGAGVGVCCNTPIVPSCPVGSLCLLDGCPGQGLNHDSQFLDYGSGVTSWARCSHPSGSYGVCCKPTIPTYDTCPDNGVCVPGAQCTDGDAYDYTNTWIPYSADYQFYGTCSFGGSPGICCKPKITHYETCPVDSICVSRARCDGEAYNHASTWTPYSQNYAYWSTCPLADGTSGVCCKPKPVIYDVCPDNSLCIPGGQCKAGQAYSFEGQWNPYSADYLYWGTCTTGAGASGVCCQPNIPHYETCPDNGVCVTGAQCNGEAVDYASVWSPYSSGYSFWSSCTHASGGKGICCIPKVPHNEVCPDNAICVPGAQCTGTAYDFTNSWNPYPSSHSYWGTCAIAGGVCCIPDIPRLETCPPASVCIPGPQCVGHSYDYLNQLNPYTQEYRYWSSCPTELSDTGIGICCKLPIADTCGVSNPPPSNQYGLGTRIQSPGLQPNEAALGEFPWQAVLFFSNYTFQCGATLITDRHVLTAAHCIDGFYPADMRIRLGEWQVNTFDEILPYYDADIEAIITHPDFKPGPVHNDISVIVLKKPVPFNYHINIPCLADGSFYQQFVGKRCYASGWGKDAFYGKYQHILKKIDLPIVPHGDCQALLRKTRLSEYFILDQSFMCAGGEENKDACKGDGGGPLVCPDANNKFFLVGITAWGINCGTKDVPGVYVDVSRVYDFISDVLEGRPVKETYYPGQTQAPVDQTQHVPYSK